MIPRLGRKNMAEDLIKIFKGAMAELPPIESSSFGTYFDSLGKSRIVLIGDGR